MSNFIKVEAIIYATVVIEDNNEDNINDQAVNAIYEKYNLNSDDEIQIRKVFK